MIKSIILLNENLTVDAQSALRRCIELFSSNTRFFMIVNNKNKLLKPILSRFCEIYVNNPFINNELVNLYQYNLNKIYLFNNIYKNRNNNIKKNISNLEEKSNKELFNIAESLYHNSYSANELLEYISNKNTNDLRTSKFIFMFETVKLEIRNEVLLIYFILCFLSYNLTLENIIFM